jgi:tetratricopeptide (TPR) repeat protein
MYLAFLSVENCSSQGAMMGVSQAAFAANPNCLRIVDAMCARTGPGMLNELSQTGPNVFSHLMGTRLEKLPKFPKALADQIETFKRPDGNPTGRETICQELISSGSPDNDKVEPSWAALGRMIQETTFEHVRVMADLIARQWGVSATDYVNQSLPLVQDHPYRFLIEAYGNWNINDNHTVYDTLKVPQSIMLTSTLRQIPLYYALAGSNLDSNGYWQRILRNGDYVAFDLDESLQYAHVQNPSQQILDEVDHLTKVSPEAPQVLAWQICYHFTPELGTKIEADHGDYPLVAQLLAQTYVNRKQWADAERCWKKYIAVSPDYMGYEALAKVYKEQKLDEKWLETLKEYLTHGQDYGLQASLVQEEIAYYYMEKGDFKSADPYATAASQTASAGGMFCEADADTGLGNYDAAETLYKEEIDHYSDTPWRWFRWCERTGHGDLQGARNAYESFVAQKGERMTSEDMIDLACTQLGNGEAQAALATFQRRMAVNPGPLSAIYIALIDDELGNTAERDAMLAKLPTLRGHDNPVGQCAAMLQKSFAAKTAAMPDMAAIGAILKNADDRTRVSGLAIIGRYLLDHGHSTEAIDCLRRCMIVKDYYPERLWIDSAMEKFGIHTWDLEPWKIVADN